MLLLVCEAPTPVSKEALYAQAVHRCKRSKDIAGQNQSTAKAVYGLGVFGPAVSLCSRVV